MHKSLPPTEQPGPVEDLHLMTASQLVKAMHEVDHAVQPAVEAAIPALSQLIDALVPRMQPAVLVNCLRDLLLECSLAARLSRLS